MFRGKGGNRRKLDRRALVERVADREGARIGQADDVARIGDVERFAVVGEELHRAREADFFAGARVAHRHVALELARADAHEGDAIAMARIHVRLNLEDEAGEARRRPDRRTARADGGGPISMKRSRKSCTPKFVTALPKKTGVIVAAQHRRAIEALAGAVEQLDARRRNCW